MDTASPPNLRLTEFIATTNFFMPIVDDPFEFGVIAAANTLSDVYGFDSAAVIGSIVAGAPRGLVGSNEQAGTPAAPGGRQPESIS